MWVPRIGGAWVIVATVKALVLACVLAGTAYAEPDPFEAPHGSNERGAALFDEGRELAKAGDDRAACDRFEQSWKIERALGTELNLAACKERLGQLVEALELFRDVARQSADAHDDRRAAFARERAAGVEARIGVLELHLASPVAPQTAVIVNGVAVTPAPVMKTPVPAGTATIHAVGQNGVSSDATVTVAARQTTEVEVPSLVDRGEHRKLGWVIAGASLATSGVGLIVFGEEEREGGVIPVGILATAIGVFVIAEAPKDRVTVVPMGAPRGGGVALSGRF
jgi:hypothetical protein